MKWCGIKESSVFDIQAQHLQKHLYVYVYYIVVETTTAPPSTTTVVTTTLGKIFLHNNFFL